MVKKFTLLAMAIGALVAFAAPAMANAAPSLTMPAGTLVSAGAGITGTSSNTVTVTPLGNLTCESVVVNATVTENTGTSVKASAAEGQSTTSTCKLGSNSITVSGIALTELSTKTSGSGIAKLKFIAHLPGSLECTFTSLSAGTPVSYTAGSSSLHIAGDLVGSPEVCGEEGEVSISGDFSLTTTSGGGAVILD